MKTRQLVHLDPGTNRYVFSLFRPSQPGVTGELSGMGLVAQRMAMALLSTPGSDAFSPQRGVALHDILKRAHHERSQETTLAEIALKVMTAANQIKSVQETQMLDASERLQDAHIERLEYDPNNLSWDIEIVLSMEDGNVTRLAID